MIEMTQLGPDDVPLRLRAQAMPDGGLVLILGAVPVPSPVMQVEAPVAAEEV